MIEIRRHREELDGHGIEGENVGEGCSPTAMQLDTERKVARIFRHSRFSVWKKSLLK